mmetsp:Transcript_19224/g.17044  ORF Transcript_19224/g.17044 Transcript_19224/m.17044 type:complete len:187 (+) Transcript_19224:7-567(+)
MSLLLDTNNDSMLHKKFNSYDSDSSNSDEDFSSHPYSTKNKPLHRISNIEMIKSDIRNRTREMRQRRNTLSNERPNSKRSYNSYYKSCNKENLPVNLSKVNYQKGRREKVAKQNKKFTKDRSDFDTQNTSKSFVINTNTLGSKPKDSIYSLVPFMDSSHNKNSADIEIDSNNIDDSKIKHIFKHLK